MYFNETAESFNSTARPYRGTKERHCRHIPLKRNNAKFAGETVEILWILRKEVTKVGMFPRPRVNTAGGSANAFFGSPSLSIHYLFFRSIYNMFASVMSSRLEGHPCTKVLCSRMSADQSFEPHNQRQDEAYTKVLRRDIASSRPAAVFTTWSRFALRGIHHIDLCVQILQASETPNGTIHHAGLLKCSSETTVAVNTEQYAALAAFMSTRHVNYSAQKLQNYRNDLK